MKYKVSISSLLSNQDHDSWWEGSPAGSDAHHTETVEKIIQFMSEAGGNEIQIWEKGSAWVVVEKPQKFTQLVKENIDSLFECNVQ